jgi:hypothetical protein
MKALLFLAVATLILAGCATPKVVPITRTMPASPDKVRPVIVSFMVDRGYSFVKSDDFTVTVEKPASAAAQVLFADVSGSGAKVRVRFTLIEETPATRVTAEAFAAWRYFGAPIEDPIKGEKMRASLVDILGQIEGRLPPSN